MIVSNLWNNKFIEFESKFKDDSNNNYVFHENKTSSLFILNIKLNTINYIIFRSNIKTNLPKEYKFNNINFENIITNINTDISIIHNFNSSIIAFNILYDYEQSFNKIIFYDMFNNDILYSKDKIEMDNLLIMEFSRKAKGFNFFSIYNNGILFFKIDGKTNLVNIINKKISYVDYEYKSETLGIIYEGEINYLYIYNLYNLNTFKVNSYNKKIKLEFIDTSDITFIIENYPYYNKNINKYTIDGENIFNSYQIQNFFKIFNVYNNIYILFFNNVEGKLYVYNDNISNYINYKIIPESIFYINLIDNLIILNYYVEKISLIIDVKNNNEFNLPPQPIYVINENIIDNNLKDDEIILDNIYYYNNFTFLNNFLFNFNSKQIFELKININAVIKNINNETYLFKFLLRRNVKKQLILEILKKIIVENGNLIHLESIISHIFSIYDFNNKEMDLIKNSINFVSNEKFLKDLNTTNYKNKNGDLIITINELEHTILEILNDNNLELNQDNILDIVYIAITNSIEYNQPLYELQKKFILLILEQKKFYFFHQIIQNCIINDSEIVAIILCELGSDNKGIAKQILEFYNSILSVEFKNKILNIITNNIYKPFFQLGIDMMFRLQAKNNEFKIQELILKYLMNSHKYFDMMILFEEYNFKTDIDFINNFLSKLKLIKLNNFSDKKFIKYLIKIQKYNINLLIKNDTDIDNKDILIDSLNKKLKKFLVNKN